MAKQIKIDRVVSSELEREPKFEDPPPGQEGYEIRLECRGEDSESVFVHLSPSAALQVADELIQMTQTVRNNSSDETNQTIEDHLQKKKKGLAL